MDAEVVPQSIDLTSALAMDAVLTGHDSFALRIFSVPSAPVGRVQARFRVKEQRFGELPKEVQDTWESDWVAGRDFCYTFATQQHGLTTLRVYPDDTITRESPVGEMGTHTGIAPVGQALVSRLHVDFGNSIWFPRLHRYGVWCDSQMAAKSPGVPYNLTVARCFLPGEKITASQSPKLLDEQHTNGRPARTLFLEKALGERPPPVLILTPPQATITQFFDPDTLTRRADRVTARLPPIEAGYWGSSEAERRARELQRHQGDRVTKKLQIEHRSLDSDPELPYSIDREALTEVDVVRGEILERYGRVPERGEIVLPSPVPLEPTTTLWRFQTFWHPQAVGFRRVLESRGLARLVRIENQQLSRRSAISEGTDLAEQLDRVGYFENEYRPTEYISQPYPRDVVDFAVAGFYSEDNWELFFHCLLYAAQCLDEDGQHDEAEEIWALLLDRSLLVDADAWRKPELFQTAPIRCSLEIEQDRPLTSLIDRDRRRLSAELLAQIQRIHLNPYQPHLIARGWPSVYARMLQIRYCEHLIRAGDAKFRLAFASDNRSLLEIASSIYDFTARCLGPAEGSLARTETAEAACFRSLTAGTGDEAAQAIDLLDAYIPPDIFEDVAPEQLFGLMARRHFCVPPNEKFDELRALVADRLLNLRSCRDIEGVQRALSLYGRRIDPMLLVRATAEGMDLDVVLGRISGARPNMQFEALWQRAVQSCECLRSFEEAWLAAEERAESEEERQLQNSLETAMQEGLLEPALQRLEDARKMREAMKRTVESYEIRHDFYATRQKVNALEEAEGGKLMQAARADARAAGDSRSAADWAWVPTAEVYVDGGMQYPIVAPNTIPFFARVGASIRNRHGGETGVQVYRANAEGHRNDGAELRVEAARLGRQAGFERRWDDIVNQKILAQKDVQKGAHDLAGAEIRVAIAELEVDLQKKRIEDSKTMRAFMRDKLGSQAFHEWRAAQMKQLQYQQFRICYDLVHQARAALIRENGLEDSSLIPDPWGARGVGAAAALLFELEEQQERKREVWRRLAHKTKSFSLMERDPLAFLELLQRGETVISIGEADYDDDADGHWFRTILRMSVDIPSVRGPYTNVNAVITQLKGEKRVRAARAADRSYYVSRPQSVEREAAHRAISHAELTGVPIMVVHVSGPEAMEQIRWAQSRGLKIMGETCTQYISLTADDLKGLNMDETGSKYVCSPPPRDHASWEAIWNGIQTGVFQAFSSDHCPFYFEGELGKKNPKARTGFRWVPNGIPDVAVRMPILWSEGVAKGRITANQFVALTSTNHARIYGLTTKGSLAPGFDADIVLWDAERKVTITQALMEHGADYTPWEGFEVTGWPQATILRGEVVMENGRILGRKDQGKFLPRALSPMAERMAGAPPD